MERLIRFLSVFSLLVSCTGLVSAETEKPEEFPFTIITTKNFFVIAEKQWLPHVITPAEWDRRTELGIPLNAWRCSEQFFANMSDPNDPRTLSLSVLVSGENGKLVRLSVSTLLVDLTWSPPVVVFGPYTTKQVVAPPGFYGLVTPEQGERIARCAMNPPSRPALVPGMKT